MKNPKLQVLILSALLFVVILPLNAFSQKRPIEIRLAHMFPVTGAQHQHIELWAKKIADDSNGRLTIRMFPSNTLLPGPEIYSGVVKGAADIGFAARYKPEGFDIGVTLPFLVGAPDTVTARRVYDDIWNKFPKEMGEEWKDVKILYTVVMTPQYFTSRKTLRRCEDLRGQQIRVPSRDIASLVKDLGGTPVFMPSAEFAIGLEKGTVDGAYISLSSIMDYKLGGKLKYVLMESVGVPTNVFVAMNKNFYSTLPADLRGILDKDCEWAKNEAVKRWTDQDEDAKRYLKAEGSEMGYLSGEEKEKLVSVYNRSCDKVGVDLDTKGHPGTEIVKFIRERLKYYAR
jgi:TRAP-type C4-dicarboxylate transport system substrate-binding protein